MTTIRIGPIESFQDGHRVEGFIQIENQEYLVYFQTQDTQLSPNLEAFIALALLPAMKLKISVIEAEGIVSQRFLDGLEEIQQVFRRWKPNYGHVKIERIQAEPRCRSISGQQGVFFSAGIDSYNSFFLHEKEISALIFLDGFDIPLREFSMRKRMIENCRLIEERFGKRMIIIESNSREFLKSFLAWGFSHGSAAASAGLLLMPEFERLYLASSGNPATDFEPFGTNREIDSCWSTEILEFVRDITIDKIEECRLISQNETALATLRVCLRYPKELLNCGECMKCVRSQVYLQVVGAADRCSAFEKNLDLGLLSKIHLAEKREDDLLFRALNLLEEQRTYPDTARVLRQKFNKPTWQNQIRKVAIKTLKRLR